MPWEPEHVVDPTEAARLLREAGFPHDDVVPFGEGWDNTAYLVDRTWVFRFPRRRIAVRWFLEETRILPRIAPHLPLPVPVPVHVSIPEDGWPFAGYRLLSGRTACFANPAPEVRRTHARPLGTFLRTLHTLDPTDAIPDEIGRADVRKRLARAREDLSRAEEAGIPVDGARVRRALESIPDDLPARDDALVHGDLYVRHLLVEGDDLAGIIDWGDVHRGDIGLDLAIAWAYLPEPDDFLDAYGPIDERTRLMARSRLVQHGLTLAIYAKATGDDALGREALDGLARLETT